MHSVICTLFEGHYHYGVAALINSLYKQGFKGHLFAGYKGDLPNWIFNKVESADILEYPGSSTMKINEDLKIHFLPLTTAYHLTNYKPDFMLSLLDGPAKDADSIFYFDPDIVITAPWSYFTYWINYGVALCEDINSPIGLNHPTRLSWRAYFPKYGISLQEKTNEYANGGFQGVHKTNRGFLEKWKAVQEAMAHDIGGLDNSSFKKTKGSTLSEDTMRRPYYRFAKTDQDALNATVEAWNGPVSFTGKEAMTFKPGERLMSHALGQPKAWQWMPLSQIIKGRSPRLMEEDYWQAMKAGPIKVYTAGYIKRKEIAMKIASFIGRFYRRSS